MRDPHAKSLLRLIIMRWKFVATVPLLTDILTPILGPLAWTDNIVFWPLLIAAVFKMFRRVEFYRDNPPPEYWKQQQ